MTQSRPRADLATGIQLASLRYLVMTHRRGPAILVRGPDPREIGCVLINYIGANSSRYSVARAERKHTKEPGRRRAYVGYGPET